MNQLVEVVRVLAGLTPEQLTLMLAFAAIGVAALAVYSIASVTKNKDR